VTKGRGRYLTTWIYAGSVAFHVALAIGAGRIPRPKQSQVVAITLAEVKKKPADKPKPLPPPPPREDKPPPPRPRPEQAKVAPEAKTEAPPPATAPAADDGFADVGVSMGNSGPGLPVPAATSQALAAAGPKLAATASTTTHKVQQLAPERAEACVEPIVRPKRKAPVAPKYTMEARQAEIEGVVKVEVTVDETGNVIAAHVLSGLGYGLDESALAAARSSTFDPATRCGRPVIGTAILPFRFEAI
jgi:protein TonB